MVLPPPSLLFLAVSKSKSLIIQAPSSSVYTIQNAHSISGAVVNFLSALALINNGVREILPFIRYISQFIDFEFKTIQGQDRGKGVVCAATWYVRLSDF